MANISTNPASAAQAYAQAASRALEGASGGSESGAASGPSFANLVQDSIAGAFEASRSAEKVSFNAVNGKADVVDLVTAVSDAEMTLQTVVAVRDKVVMAYQEIMRMPI